MKKFFVERFDEEQFVKNLQEALQGKDWYYAIWTVGYPEELEKEFELTEWEEQKAFFEGILQEIYEKVEHMLGENNVFEIDFGGTEFPPYTITLYKNVLLL